MTTPFASLDSVTKSASARRLSPFANLDPLTKEASFWGGVGDNIWNSTMKPIGEGLREAGSGIGNMLSGAGSYVGNAIAAPFQSAYGAIRSGTTGAIQGALNDRPGGFMRGAAQGAQSGWDAAGQGMAAGGNQFSGGAGQVGAGLGAAASGVNPYNLASNFVEGAGSGIVNGLQAEAPGYQPLRQTGAAGPSGPAGAASRPAPAAAWQGPQRPQQPSMAQPTAQDFSRVMGSYNPNSALDQRKAQRIREMWQANGGRVSPNQVYADRGYGQIKAGAAKGIAGSISSLLRGGALKFNQASRASRPPLDAWKLPGIARGISAGQRGVAAGLSGTSKAINKSPALQKAINYGAPTVGLAGAGVVGHGIGRSSGEVEGRSQGFDLGADYGIRAAQANTPGDPGFLGRLMALFTGQAEGPNPEALKSMLASQKSDILKRLQSA